MFFDEDGDLAHEFFEERKSNISGRVRMKRLRHNLTPQVGKIHFIVIV